MKKLLYLSVILALTQACGKSSMDSSGDPGYSGQGGSLARFALAGDHLFVVNNTKLKVFDITNPQSVTFRTEQDLGVNVETAFARDPQTLFIGSTTGMVIYDISNPPQIAELSRYAHVVSCDPVVANDRYAFVTLRSSTSDFGCNRDVNQLDILDISDLRNPKHLKTYNMEHPIGLGLYGDTLLVCDEGIKVMDVSDVMSAHTINIQKDIAAVDIIPFNNLMIVASETGFAQYRYKNGNLSLLSKL